MALLRALILLILIPVFTLICSILAFLVFAPFLSRHACDGLIRFWAKTILAMSGVKVRVSGLENLVDVDSAIFISNHLSHFDIPVLYSCIPLTFRMAAKAELFQIPLFGRALSAFGFFRVERESPENTRGTIQNMAKRFQNGESVWMAPEGTRQNLPQIGPFKMGAFFLALKAQKTLVPVVIFGTQKVLPKNSLLISPKEWHQQVYVEIGKPSLASQWPFEQRHELRDHVRTQMEQIFSKFCP